MESVQIIAWIEVEFTSNGFNVTHSDVTPEQLDALIEWLKIHRLHQDDLNDME